MFPKIADIISNIDLASIPDDRKKVLNPIRDFIQNPSNQNKELRFNFICTHNSRRSHLSQIWAQVIAHHFGFKNVVCYSGGTAATSLFSKVIDTLLLQGFNIEQLSDSENPIYSIRFDDNAPSIIGFSKVYNHSFNPKSDFVAMMTCNDADENCPVVFGASARFPLNYEDPKIYDGTPNMNEKYLERSLQIAGEMFYLFEKHL
jgi:arsenate reductase